MLKGPVFHGLYIQIKLKKLIRLAFTRRRPRIAYRATAATPTGTRETEKEKYQKQTTNWFKETKNSFEQTQNDAKGQAHRFKIANRLFNDQGLQENRKVQINMSASWRLQWAHF